MEGSWRGVAWVATVLAACALAAGASGCGDDESGAAAPASIEAKNPERTFAPLIEVAADEPWQPMSARWFIERSIFWFAEDDGCADRKIALGHTFPEQWTPEYDWIFPKGLGGWSWPAYFRNPYDAKCEYDFDKRFYADQLTRPNDPGVRVEGIRRGEGFYLDLADAARSGPAVADAIDLPVYAERTDEGDDGVRLTYWTLFGMHGTPGESDAHEGDWVRVDVLLEDAGDSRYRPVAVQSGLGGREASWSSTRRVGGSHPVVRLAAASHAVSAARSGDCAGCARWETWKSLADVRKELWYGFGGAWGQPGATDATTGPLGPHGIFPTAADKARERAGG
jgi:hypothetical protein